MKPGPMVYGPKGEQVADLRADLLPKDERLANSRLIVAAPDLLEALRYYVDQHEHWRLDMPERNENDGKVWNRVLRIAHKAIAKATNPKEAQ
jgi:hypothetical protein